MRVVIHDWGFSNAVKILRNLRDAAVVGKTKLVLVEQVVKCACKEGSVASDIKLPETPAVPDFLLPNLGRANTLSLYMDIQMLTALNGQERTVGHWVDVAKQSGWKITHFYAPPAALFQHIVAEAV